MDETTKARMDGIFAQVDAAKEAERQRRENARATSEAFQADFWAAVDERVLPALHELVAYLKSKGMEAEVVDDRGRKVWNCPGKGVGIKFNVSDQARALKGRAEFFMAPENGVVMYETMAPLRTNALRHTAKIQLKAMSADFVNRQVTELLGNYLRD